MFISHYRKKSKIMVHGQQFFCRGTEANTNDTINYGDAYEYASSNGYDLQFLEDHEIFRACHETDHYHPNVFELEIYR